MRVLALGKGMFWVLFLQIIFGCAYSIKKTEASFAGLTDLPENSEVQIFVPLAENLTTRSGIEVTLTSAIRRRLSRVKGLRVIDTPKGANLMLVSKVVEDRVESSTPLFGSAATSAAGGIAESQAVASTLKLRVQTQTQLLEVVEPLNQSSPRRVLWSRYFLKEAFFDGSKRFYEPVTSAVGGSSSGVHINESREELSWQVVSDELALQMLDQVTQSF